MDIPTTPGRPSAAPIARIFLSHSHHDDAFTLRLAEQLRAAGAYVWLDMRDIKEGDFLKRINEGLVKCDWLVLVETPASLSSEPVVMEVNAAQNRVLYHQMRGVIRFVAAARDPRSVPPTWATLQYYDATANYTAALARLLDAVREPAPADATVSAMPAPSPVPPTAPASPEQAVAQRLLGEIRAAYDAADWHAVADKTALLLRLAPDAGGVELYRLRGRALLELGDDAGATTAFEAALKRDPLDLPTLRATARAYVRASQPAKAAPLLQDAIALVSAAAERLDILREYVPVLQALNRWADVLARCDEALRLQRDDPGWLALRLDALMHLGRQDDALAVMRQIAERPQASAAEWAAFARQTASATHNNRNAIRAVLDDAARRFPDDAALAQARRELLPPAVPREGFPERLERLGFAAEMGTDPVTGKPVAIIRPPLCSVPAGPFLMGSDPHQDSEAQANEQPQHRVTLTAYQIGKFPVTVAEYACFVAGGHAVPQKGTYGVDWQTQLTRLDHPVTSVTLHDVQDYASWLARLTSEQWALPSEAEWEKAARWDVRGNAGLGAARIYPWGDRFDVARCNVKESGVGTTTAVGTYGPENSMRDGSSPYGAQEMVGNVWEWTGTTVKPYPYAQSDGREDLNSAETRAVRGSSWVYTGTYSKRASYRGVGSPGYFRGDGGFRVVLHAADDHSKGHNIFRIFTN